MTLVRWLCISLLALTVPGALHAQTVSFTTLGLTTLFGQESQVPLAGEPGCTTSIWSTLWTPEGPFAPVCVQECLKAWRECWDRGDYEDRRVDPCKPSGPARLRPLKYGLSFDFQYVGHGGQPSLPATFSSWAQASSPNFAFHSV